MGPSVATRIILNSRLVDEFKVIHIDTADRRPLNTLGRIDLTNILLALRHYRLLFTSLLSSGADVVYIPVSQTAVGFLRDLPFILLSKLFGKKVVLHLRGGYFREFYNGSGWAMRHAIKAALKMTDRMIVLGNGLKALFYGLLPEERISVVPNGLDLDCSGAAANNPAQDGLTILFLSNFIKTKGFLEALYSVRPVINSHANTKYVFAGAWLSDIDKLEAEDYIKREGISSHVEFRGPVTGNEKLRLLCGADVFVFPTYYPMEGHPWSIVEAMAAGLPVISTDQGAIKESVIDGTNGFLVEKKNPLQIAEKIKLLADDPELMRKMGESSRRLHLEKFTEEKFIGRMIEAFREVLKD
jgi:glycosyltransferase involved in cell wall biosynthesis